MTRAITAGLLGVLLLSGTVVAQEGEAPSEVSMVPAQKGAAPKGNEQASESYTVQSGDTLWDLSSRFLGNPWYWPKVWSYNPQIENPHWIYPGNTIRFYPVGDEMPAQVEAGGEPDGLPAQRGEIDDVSMGNMKTAENFGEDDDVVAISAGTKFGYTPPKRTMIRQDGLITKFELDNAGVIEKAYSDKDLLDNYDKVYVRFRNKAQVRVGERFSIFRTRELIRHPVTKAEFGYLTQVIGSLHVVSIDDEYASAIIDQTFDEIVRGVYVAPLGNFDKPLITKENSREVTGVILAALEHNASIMGESHMVFIDRGSADGVEEGNTFSVVKRGDPVAAEGTKGVPYENAGTIVILDVKENASAGMVTKSLKELVVGDKVVMRPRAQQAMNP